MDATNDDADGTPGTTVVSITSWRRPSWSLSKFIGERMIRNYGKTDWRPSPRNRFPNRHKTQKRQTRWLLNSHLSSDCLSMFYICSIEWHLKPRSGCFSVAVLLLHCYMGIDVRMVWDGVFLWCWNWFVRNGIQILRLWRTSMQHPGGITWYCDIFSDDVRQQMRMT